MPRLTAHVAGLLGDWWTLALDAGFSGYTTTDLQAAAKDIADRNNLTLAFRDYTGLSVLYGYARRMFNASQTVRNADDADYIQSQHIAIPPWARDETAQNANPIWHVTYEFTTLDENGFESTEYKTSVFEQSLPSTVGDLKDAVNEDAQALADKYGRQLLSVGLHQILAV